MWERKQIVKRTVHGDCGCGVVGVELGGVWNGGCNCR